MKKPLFFGKEGLAICISLFIHPSKPIKKKYPKRPKTHDLDNLVLIMKVENTIRINIGASNVYIFLHADFEGIEFYAARRYVHMTKEGI